MNFEICKKCLSIDPCFIAVMMCCDGDLNKGDTEVILTDVLFFDKSGIFPVPRCAFKYRFLLDVKFLAGKNEHPFVDMFYLNNDLLGEFFNLMKEVCGYKCPYFLEHQLYDWSVKA